MLGLVLTLSAALCGFALGSWIAGQWLVPKGSGLAGPAMVLGYGLIGAAIAGLAAIVASIKLPGRGLVGLTVPFAIAGVVIVGIGVSVFLQSSSEHEAHMEEAYKRLPVFHIVMEQNDPDARFQTMDMDWATRRYTATSDGRTCSAQMSGPEAVKMLTALRNIDALLMHDSNPCGVDTGSKTHRLVFEIQESMPPYTQGNLTMSPACLDRVPELDDTFKAAEKIFRSGDFPKSCG